MSEVLTEVRDAEILMEQCFLGCLFLHGDEEMVEAVTSNAFWRTGHRTLYEVLSTIIMSGRSVDVAIVEAELSQRKQLENVGGIDYLFELAEVVPSAAHWATYAESVTSAALRRAYVSKAQKLVSLVKSGADIDEIRTFDETPPNVGHVPRAPIVSVSEIELPDDDEDQGVSTGFPSLDALISTKGYPKGQMTMVSAYHKGGKSSFMASSYVHLAQQGMRVLYATFADLNAVRLKRRLLRNLTGWSKMPARDLYAQDDYRQALGDIDLAWTAWLYDATRLRTGGDVETFCRWLESAHSRYRFDAVFVDYAQKMTSSSRKANSTTAEQDVCSTELSRCFERTGIAGIVGSQITEGTEGRKSITKGSRKWEEDAAWVLRIEEETETTKKIKVPYSRFGVQGKEVVVGWNVDRLRMEDRSAS